MIYPGIDLDVAAVTHPVEVSRLALGQTKAVSCSDLSISYEIYAEDMPTIKGMIVIHSQEILDAMAKGGM